MKTRIQTLSVLALVSFVTLFCIVFGLSPNSEAQVTTGPVGAAGAIASTFTNTAAVGQHPEATTTAGIGKWTWLTNTIGVTVDGGGSALTTGVKGYITVPYNCTIISAITLADVSGSVVFDVWKDTYANYPPTVADTITASAKPTISSATKATDSTLTGWTTTCTAGDVLGFNVDSATTITRATLTLTVIH